MRARHNSALVLSAVSTLGQLMCFIWLSTAAATVCHSSSDCFEYLCAPRPPTPILVRALSPSILVHFVESDIAPALPRRRCRPGLASAPPGLAALAAVRLRTVA